MRNAISSWRHGLWLLRRLPPEAAPVEADAVAQVAQQVDAVEAVVAEVDNAAEVAVAQQVAAARPRQSLQQRLQ